MTHVSTVTGFGRWARQPRQPEQQHPQPCLARTNATEETPFRPPPQLPLELWNAVFCWLYPSQLGTIAVVSRTWCDLVQRHQVWKTIFVAAGLVVHPQIIPDRNWVPDYFELVQDKADKICEMCLKQHHKNESEGTLPVTMSTFNDNAAITIATTTTPTMTAPITKLSVPHFAIQMCRPCRIEYYSKNPEPIPSRLETFFWGDNNYKVIPVIDSLTATFLYGVSNYRIRTLPFVDAPSARAAPTTTNRHQTRRILQEVHVLQLARKFRGGDVGIEAYQAVHRRTCWVFSDPKDDAMKRRQLLLRSLLYDKGLPLLPMSLACNEFFRSGHGDPIEIVKELDADNWLKCCTSYYSPCNDVAYQVKLRLQPDGRNHICRPKRTPRHSKGDGEWNTLLALDKWLANRLYDGNYRSFKLDPEGPMKPPESVWPMLDKIDMGHTALVHAAQTAFDFLSKKNTVEVWEGCDYEVAKEIDIAVYQVRSIIYDATTATTRSTTTSEHGSGIKGSSRTLSMLLEDELGSGWETLVVQRVKTLIVNSKKNPPIRPTTPPPWQI
ncbi:MAG: hypothetical protein J3R72DRAFT_459174 [Linnemannia gamsii]|nr:MAG: hypothetical protein J3R72DRAFT_459174 [Linnemannia gamsii]